MDDHSSGRPFLESQGRILVPDYDNQSQSSQDNGPLPQLQKKRNNSGNNKPCKKSSKTGKQSQPAKLQTTQQPAVTSSQASPGASTSSYTNARWSSSWNHRSYGCQAAPTGSLLEEVLNEKKMALLKSSEVMEFLQGLQKDVQIKKEEDLKTHSDGCGSILDNVAPSKQTTKRSQKRKKTSTRGQADKTPVTSGGSSRQPSPGLDLNGQDPELVLFGRNQERPSSDGRRAPNQGASQADIWSKEASAFSTVTSTFPTTPSQ